MKKNVLAIFIVVLVAVGVFLFANRGGAKAVGGVDAAKADPQVAAPAEAAIPPVLASQEINVAGRLTPARRMDLAFQTEGLIAEVLVKEGDLVEEGQVLARLREERELRLAVSRSRLEVMNAEKAVKDLRRGAPLEAAQLNYDMVQLRKELEKAEKRRLAMEYPKATQKSIDDAYRDYKAAEDVVKQVEDYGSSENKEAREMYKEAVKVRDMALSKYNYLIAKYTDTEKSEAEANVMLYKTKLEDMQRKFDIYSQGPDPEEEAIAQARLEIARAELASAEAKFADVELRAPFSGTVVSMSMEKGQLINPNEEILLLADFSRWHIETEDLTELGVTRIHEGAPAMVRFDALPDTSFEGKVVSIKNIGENKKGDITYTATIEILNSDPRLRWNMTSPIVIKTK